MTAGPGPQGDPQGQPPQWPQPGPPPYGSPGPHGPPPWGYAAAPPPGFGQPPPEPLERPLAVRAGLGAFVASIALSVAGSLFAFVNWDEYVAQALAQQPELERADLQEAGFDPAAFAETVATFFIVVGLGFTMLYALFVWFAWRGHNWARIVLFVVGGFGIAGGLVNVAGLGTAGSSPFPSLTALSIFSFLAVLVGVVLLAGKPSSDWFRSEKLRRAMTG